MGCPLSKLVSTASCKALRLARAARSPFDEVLSLALVLSNISGSEIIIFLWLIGIGRLGKACKKLIAISVHLDLHELYLNPQAMKSSLEEINCPAVSIGIAASSPISRGRR